MITAFTIARCFTYLCATRGLGEEPELTVSASATAVSFVSSLGELKLLEGSIFSSSCSANLTVATCRLGFDDEDLGSGGGVIFIVFSGEPVVTTSALAVFSVGTLSSVSSSSFLIDTRLGDPVLPMLDCCL